MKEREKWIVKEVIPGSWDVRRENGRPIGRELDKEDAERICREHSAFPALVEALEASHKALLCYIHDAGYGIDRLIEKALPGRRGFWPRPEEGNNMVLPSPTPYKIQDDVHIHTGESIRRGRFVASTGGVFIGSEESSHEINKANARYIVTACNAFPLLVDALEEIRCKSKYCNLTTGDVVQKIRELADAALDAVKGVHSEEDRNKKSRYGISLATYKDLAWKTCAYGCVTFKECKHFMDEMAVVKGETGKTE